MSRQRTRPRLVQDQPTLAARIDRALYRLRNANGLPLQLTGDGSDPEAVLCACNEHLTKLQGMLGELADAVIEQVGCVQTDRLARALSVAKTLHD